MLIPMPTNPIHNGIMAALAAGALKGNHQPQKETDEMMKTIVIDFDPCTKSPRNITTQSTLYCTDSLGDVQTDDVDELMLELAEKYSPGITDKVEDFADKAMNSGLTLEQAVEQIEGYRKKVVDPVIAVNYVTLPVYMMDRDSTSLRTTPFHGQSDSSRIGIIAMSRDEIFQNWPEWKKLTAKRVEKVKSILKSEIDIYSNFVSGNCYDFVIYEHPVEDYENPKQGKMLASMGGFIGEIEQWEDNGMSDYWPEDWKETCQVIFAPNSETLHEPDLLQ